MIRKHIWITNSQKALLAFLSEERNISESAVVREALERFSWALLNGQLPVPPGSGDVSRLLLDSLGIRMLS